MTWNKMKTHEVDARFKVFKTFYDLDKFPYHKTEFNHIMFIFRPETKSVGYH